MPWSERGREIIAGALEGLPAPEAFPWWGVLGEAERAAVVALWREGRRLKSVIQPSQGAL